MNDNKLSTEQLTRDFGKGFEERELRKIRQFYLTFPIRDALRPELGWTHYRLVLRVSDVKARNFYIEECVKSRWSTRQLERQIHTLFYERLLSSQNKEAVVRYTLAEDNRQIFASKYMLYLPTEEELKNEIYAAISEK
jgi:hypothetical protein